VKVRGHDDEGVKAGRLAARGNARADAEAKAAAASVGISTLSPSDRKMDAVSLLDKDGQRILDVEGAVRAAWWDA